ncbi:MAG: hypothetical protein ABIG10_00725 [bacterium]
MPRDLRNWNFKDVVSFLKQHFFVNIHSRKGGSHQYFKGFVNNEIKLVEVQYHGSKAVKVRCLQHDIIPKSGIPEAYWKKWANAGRKNQRKKIQYKQARFVDK